MALNRGAPNDETKVGEQSPEQGESPPPATLNEPRNADKQTPESQAGDNHNSQPLKTNMEVASGAEKSMDPTWWGVGVDAIGVALSFVSILLVVLALRQTNKSLKLAQKERATATRRAIAQAEETAAALKHAEASAIAMSKVAEVSVENAEQVRESVIQQRILGRMQMRPILSVLLGPATFQDENHFFDVRPMLQNTGNTPAKQVRCRITAAILPTPLSPDFKFWMPDNVQMGKNTIGPNQTGFMYALIPVFLPDNLVSKIMVGDEYGFFTWGLVTYKDAFGRLYRTTFSQQILWNQSLTPNENWEVIGNPEGIYLGRHNAIS